jgi:hypothetical protein
LSASVRGATPAEWGHLDFVLGLGANLLPCVPAAPDVKVLAGSSLAGKVGKIPSVFNREGEAHGIKAWQKKEILGNEITFWANDGRYNCCLRTGPISDIYAIDVDVDDSAEAEKIYASICKALGGLILPKRMRPNSGKFLLMFRLVP